MEKIKKLIKGRLVFWQTYQDSWDETIGEYGEYTIDEPKEVDELGDKIRELINEGANDLPVDFVLESLTHLGQAPQVVYDDNGHFAVSGTGMDPVMMTDSGKYEENVSISAFIEPDMWKDTIREALKHYLKN